MSLLPATSLLLKLKALPTPAWMISLEANSIAIFSKRDDGIYNSINQAGANLLASQPDRVIGREDSLFFDSSSVRLMSERDTYVRGLERPHSYESVVYSKKGWRHFRSVKTVLRSPRGTKTDLFGLSADITNGETTQASELLKVYFDLMYKKPLELSRMLLTWRAQVTAVLALRALDGETDDSMAKPSVSDEPIPN